MDKSKPPIPPNEFRLRSASERASADIDDAPPRVTNSGEFAVERQSRSGQAGLGESEPPDRPSVAVYYRNQGEVSEGFFMALRAMGVAALAPLEPPKQTVRMRPSQDR
jgi:hypothetical protein